MKRGQGVPKYTLGAAIFLLVTLALFFFAPKIGETAQTAEDIANIDACPSTDIALEEYEYWLGYFFKRNQFGSKPDSETLEYDLGRTFCSQIFFCFDVDRAVGQGKADDGLRASPAAPCCLRTFESELRDIYGDITYDELEERYGGRCGYD